jgi:hypothetical protein
MKRLLSFGIALSLLACQATIDNATPLSRGSLEMTDVVGAAVPPTEINGVFLLEGKEVHFKSLYVEDALFEITVDLNGMTLYALIDVAGHVAVLDGFASENGEDTQVLEADRELLLALYEGLNEVLPKEVPEIAKLLRRSIGIWAEHPQGLDTAETVMGEASRGFTMLCDYANCGGWEGDCTEWRWYDAARHDDSWYGGDDPKAQQIVQLGDHFRCDGEELYYVPETGEWACGEPDHWARPSVVGNCFGRVGPGCGDDAQYTRDATDHDGCVRNGHALASMWCNDEFVSAIDDELFAASCY